MLTHRTLLLSAWAIIVAQLLVLVVGHGRIVVCFDEKGSSHIELVTEESCLAGADDAYSQSAYGIWDTQMGAGSSTSCVDELVGLPATFTGTRYVFVGAETGLYLEPAIGVESWLVSVGVAVEVAGVDFGAYGFLSELRRSIRTTVLVL